MRRTVCSAFRSMTAFWSKKPASPVDGEALFAEWLDEHCISYERDYEVTPGNVDFLIKLPKVQVLCDVKEVHASSDASGSVIDADGHIRSDIRKLRAKFRSRPVSSVLLVTMNFSPDFFTGLTVSRALVGEVGVVFDRQTAEITKPTHHLPQGNASLTTNQNRSISGVLVWNGRRRRHVIFLSPFAEHPLDGSLFPNTDVVTLDRDASPSAIRALSDRMFWPIEHET